jgi:arabinofuranan 3-O-arabinosyltransferase
MPSAIEYGGRVAPEVRVGPRLATPRLREQWDRLLGAPTRTKVSLVVTVGFWVASAIVWALLCTHVSHTGANLGWDLVTSWRATVVFVHGGPPYTPSAIGGRGFVYPPSSLLLMSPIAALSLRQIQLLGLVVTAVTAWVAVMISAAAAGRRWWGLTAAVSVFALRFAKPLIAELSLQNMSVLCLLALVGFYWFASHDRWLPAAVTIGVSLSLKPLLLAVLIVFLLARKWRALAVALTIPAALNVVALLLVRDARDVLSKLPGLLNRAGSGALLNSAWVDVLRTFGFPHWSVILIRLATAAVAVLAGVLAWRRLENLALRCVTTTTALLLGVFLAGTLSENHYMLTLVPFAVTAVMPCSPLRWFPGWVGILLLMGLIPPASLLGISVPANQSAFTAFGMAITLLTIVAALAFRQAKEGTVVPLATPATPAPPTLAAEATAAAGAT